MFLVFFISEDRSSSVSRGADDSRNCNVIGFPSDTLAHSSAK